MAEIYDDRPCFLGEGPLWHPERGTLFWFDILNARLLSRDADGTPREWTLPEMFSAAGWIDADRLFMASETGLWTFEIGTGALTRVAALEADNPVTRSNDGRADPWGGFWIGSMGKKAEAGAGTIWRYYRGEVRQLYPGVTIPNAISFTPDRRFAHFAGLGPTRVWRVALDPDTGWPTAEPEVYLDLAGQAGAPDGAVCDAEGNLWLAEWGAGRVACYDATGRFLRSVEVAGRHSSCPAFGGAGFRQLFVTTARQNLGAAALKAEPRNGCTFVADPGATGLPEYRVIL